jgi:pyruvate/2-oxoglutarate dehydrogenase complex dihydrolipoamide acyltransferase (E2) component
MTNKGYRLEPIPRSRRFSTDAGRLARSRHTVHALIEVDVTEARRWMRARAAATQEKPSFTAFVVHCLGKAVQSNPHVHAYRDWRSRLVIYDDVNVNVMLEAELNGRRVPMPHILRAVNRRTYWDLHNEIRAVQAQPRVSREAGFMRWFLALPWPVRRLFYWVVQRVPQSFRENSTSVLVSAVGMFGHGGGWGIPAATFTLVLLVGGIAEKPGVVEGRIEIREILDLTVSLDHDIVDGAPMARFVNELRGLLEGCYGLEEPPDSA